MNRQELLLVQLGEECGEVVKNVSKALRFGITDGYPDSGETNAEAIVRELNDVLAVVSMLVKDNVLDGNMIDDETAHLEKVEKVEKWLLHSKKMGVLTS